MQFKENGDDCGICLSLSLSRWGIVMQKSDREKERERGRGNEWDTAILREKN